MSSESGKSSESGTPRGCLYSFLAGLAATVIGGIVLAIILPANHGGSSQGSNSATPSNTPVTSTQAGVNSSPTSQSGYRLLWHQTITIGSAGILLQPNHPVSVTGNSTPDLEYSSPSSGLPGWGINSGALEIWSSASAPSPMDCASATNNDAAATIAKVGDRYCYNSNGGPVVSGPATVVSMLVTGIQPGGVTVNAWAWAPPS